MDIRALRYFLAVAHYHNFTRASEAMHVTQPAISKMIKSLEEELGVMLIHREDRQLDLTDAGKIVQQHAEEVLQSLENMRDKLGDMAELKRGEIRVGLPPMIGAAFFPQVLTDFYEQYPLIDVRLLETGSRMIEASLLAGNLDLGISVLPVDQEIFEVFRFFREDVVAVLHPAHPLANEPAICLAALKDSRFVMYQEEFVLHSRIIEACQAAGFTPNIVSESSQWDFIAAMVASNLGVALMPPTICQRLDPRRIRVKSLTDVSIPWDLAIIWKRNRYLSAAAQAWMALTSARLRNLQPGASCPGPAAG